MTNFKINHIAIWTRDLIKMKDFYVKYFGFKASNIYENKLKGFQSYFLNIDNSCQLELMTKTDIQEKYPTGLGLAHFSVSVGSKEKVDELTQILQNDGYKTSAPRTTGDGYYESTVLDLENNIIEITV